jgi:hypothetical protein
LRKRLGKTLATFRNQKQRWAGFREKGWLGYSGHKGMGFDPHGQHIQQVHGRMGIGQRR